MYRGRWQTEDETLLERSS